MPDDAVFDAGGRRMKVLLQGPREAGRHEAWWHGRDESGREVASGVYFCRLQVGEETLSKRMALLQYRVNLRDRADPGGSIRALPERPREGPGVPSLGLFTALDRAPRETLSLL